MEFGIWLDGVILNQDITDTLSSIYKGIQAKVEPSTEINPDWSDFYKKIRDRGKLFILSPFSKEITQGVLNSLGINESFVYNNGRTKPSKEPTERLVNEFKIDPLRLVIIGSSPLDLL
ncbi:MAG: HAD family hydrolase, partial [Metallosphaera sp.]